MEKLNELIENLSPEMKKRLIMVMAVIAVILLIAASIAAYSVKRQNYQSDEIPPDFAYVEGPAAAGFQEA